MTPACPRCHGKLMREPGMFPGEGATLVCMICGYVAYSAASMAASRQAVADHDAVVEHRIEAFRLTRLERVAS